jgi:hypothetical protein
MLEQLQSCMRYRLSTPSKLNAKMSDEEQRFSRLRSSRYECRIEET